MLICNIYFTAVKSLYIIFISTYRWRIGLKLDFLIISVPTEKNAGERTKQLGSYSYNTSSLLHQNLVKECKRNFSRVFSWFWRYFSADSKHIVNGKKHLSKAYYHLYTFFFGNCRVERIKRAWGTENTVTVFRSEFHRHIYHYRLWGNTVNNYTK